MKLIDELSKIEFGMSRTEAHDKMICVKCKESPKFYSNDGFREYDISGLCEYCFDEITDPEPCQICNKPESFHEHKPHRGECDSFRPAPSNSIGD